MGRAGEVLVVMFRDGLRKECGGAHTELSLPNDTQQQQQP